MTGAYLTRTTASPLWRGQAAFGVTAWSAAPTLDRTRLPQGPAAVGFGGGTWAGQRDGRVPGAGMAAVMTARTPRLSVGMTGCGVAWRTRTRCGAPRMAGAEGRGGSGNCRSITCSV